MMNRRSFLRMLGMGAAAAAVAPLLPEPEPIAEPVRKMWFVPSGAPVGSRIEPASSLVNFSQVFKERYGAFTDAKVENLMQRGELYRELEVLYGAKVVTHPYVKQGEVWGIRGSLYVSQATFFDLKDKADAPG